MGQGLALFPHPQLSLLVVAMALLFLTYCLCCSMFYLLIANYDCSAVACFFQPRSQARMSLAIHCQLRLKRILRSSEQNNGGPKQQPRLRVQGQYHHGGSARPAGQCGRIDYWQLLSVITWRLAVEKQCLPRSSQQHHGSLVPKRLAVPWNEATCFRARHSVSANHCSIHACSQLLCTNHVS